MCSPTHPSPPITPFRPHLPHSGRSLKQQDKGSSEAPPTSSSSSKPPSSQLTEWSKLLFKCIKPVGDPDFRLNGDIATHTITLKLDMTELDLGTPPSSSRQLCTKDDLRRYRKLGLTSEEVVEVAMKLNALKALGINLRIEDLFDEEGLLLAENQDLLRGGGGEEAVGDDVYFLDDKGTGEGGGLVASLPASLRSLGVNVRVCILGLGFMGWRGKRTQGHCQRICFLS